MRHKKKNRLVAVESVLVLTATADLFIKAQRYALVWRGYFAIGGEFMLLLIPIIYYVAKREIKDIAADFFHIYRDTPEE